MANLFRRLLRSLTRQPKSAPVPPISPNQQRELEKRQRELAKQLGHIPGVKITGVSPEEAKRLHALAQQRLRNKGVAQKIKRQIRDITPPRPPEAREGWTQWYNMNSTNVDRIRYLESARLCQVVYKNGRLYQYEGVEPVIFMGWLQTHSPGQYQWYVIRAYGYRYTQLASNQPVSPPGENRFEGEPFAVPEEIERFQRQRGRGAVDVVATAVGVSPPPNDAWKQFRPRR